MFEPRDVTGVIPCFNDGNVVGKAVTSLLNEGVGCVLVVDDGSDDGDTKHALDELERAIRALRVLRIANGGPARARYAGLQAATTPLVWFLDADDEVVQGSVAPLLAAISVDQGVDAVWGSIRLRSNDRIIQQGVRLDPWRVTYVNEMPSSFLARRTSLLSIGPPRYEGLFEDWAYWMQAAEGGLIGRGVTDPALFYSDSGTRRAGAGERQAGEIRHALSIAFPALFSARRETRTESHSQAAMKAVLPLASRLPTTFRVRDHAVHLLTRAFR